MVEVARARLLEGADHPSVANTLNNLARLYGDQGRYADALGLSRRAHQ